MSAPFFQVYVQGSTPVSADELNTFVQGGALLANLQSFTGTVGMTVYLAGLNAPGDGGQGLFYWNATGSANDGVNNIQPYGAAVGCWTRIAWGLFPITVSLAANVSLAAQNTYYDGPSVAQGTAGTWFVSGTVTLTDTAGAATFNAKLWDGTTVIASAQAKITAASGIAVVALSGYLANPQGNFRITVEDVSSTSGEILSNASGNSRDSTITAIRVG